MAKRNRNDLTGQRFGRLVVLGKNQEKSGKNSYWDCLCDCGNKKTISRSDLTSGHTKSCGCLKTENLTGKRFGKLVAIENVGIDKWGHVIWKCKCDCGNETIVRGSSLTSGDTISCGCSHFLDITGQRFGKLTAIKMSKPHCTSGGNTLTTWECLCDCGNMVTVTLNDLRSGKTKSCGCLRNSNTYRKSEDDYMIGTDCNGNEFYFDEEDFNLVSDYVWYIDSEYVITRVEQKRVSMHRLIMNPSDDKEIDHINGNKADNRKINLRICSHNQNMYNKPVYKNNKTGVKGVTYEKSKYRARIVANKKVIELGCYSNKEDAFEARMKAEKIHGDFSYYKREEILNGRGI